MENSSDAHTFAQHVTIRDINELPFLALVTSQLTLIKNNNVSCT